jgi:hypothetical protein
MAVAPDPLAPTSARSRSKGRDLAEVLVGFGLIMMVIWTPRAAQRVLWWVAAAGVLTLICFSFEGWAAWGMRAANFWRSLWIVGAALAASVAAMLIAAHLGTLHLPRTALGFIGTYVAYAIWSGVQQFLLQGFFLLRFQRIMPRAGAATLVAAVLFSSAHLPNPILTPATLIWGALACGLFLRYRNLYPLALAHAILGITIAITVPGTVDHNMRVGLGYLTYNPHRIPHRHLPLVQPSPSE